MQRQEINLKESKTAISKNVKEQFIA